MLVMARANNILARTPALSFVIGLFTVMLPGVITGDLKFLHEEINNEPQW